MFVRSTSIGAYDTGERVRRLTDDRCDASDHHPPIHSVSGLERSSIDRWNGLMISALATGSRVLGEPKYLEAARKAGLTVGAVGWGYATVDFLRAQQPDYLFLSMDEIRQAVTRL